MTQNLREQILKRLNEVGGQMSSAGNVRLARQLKTGCGGEQLWRALNELAREGRVKITRNEKTGHVVLTLQHGKK